MDYTFIKPFDKICINEYSSRNSSSIRENYFNVSSSIKKGRTYISKTYSVRNSSTNFVSVKITPDYDIRYFSITIHVEGKPIILIILLSINIPLISLMFIFGIVCVILTERKKRILAKQNNQIIASPQPENDPEEPQDYLLFHRSPPEDPPQLQLKEIPLEGSQ